MELHYSSAVRSYLYLTNAGGYTFTDPYRSQPSPLHYLENRQGAEFYADEVWQGVKEVVQGLTADCPHPEQIAALSIASMEIGVALDEMGTPLAPTQLWFDTRSHKTLMKWLETVDEFEIYKRSGMRVYAYSSLSKMLYEREYMPDVYRRTRKWVYLVSYFMHKMIGQYALDPSVLCRSHLYDIHKGEWSDELCALTGTDKSLLPDIVKSGTLMGEMRRDLAEELGFKASVSVVMGAFHNCCSSMALQIRQNHDLADLTISAEIFATVVDPDLIATDRRCFERHVNIGTHVYDDKMLMYLGNASPGHMFDWLIRNFALCGNRPKKELYALIAKQAALAPVGSNGLIFYPVIGGSLNCMAQLLGLRVTHTLPDLCRSLYEGLSFSMMEVMDGFCEFTGQTFPVVRFHAPAGHIPPVWAQIKADIMQREVITSDLLDSAAMGAALLAGVGVGVFRDVDEAIQIVHAEETSYRPIPENVETYQYIKDTVFQDVMDEFGRYWTALETPGAEVDGYQDYKLEKLRKRIGGGSNVI